MRIEVTKYVFAPPALVWAVLVDWERQPEWMVDAQDVHVVGERREGVGVRLECPTNILGVVVQDVMEVTAWDEPRLLAVRHRGRLIAGTGEFEITPTAVGTRVTWRETIDVPLGRLGEAGARLVVRPIVMRIFDRSMDRFKRLCEMEARRPHAGVS